MANHNFYFHKTKGRQDVLDEFNLCGDPDYGKRNLPHYIDYIGTNFDPFKWERGDCPFCLSSFSVVYRRGKPWRCSKCRKMIEGD